MSVGVKVTLCDAVPNPGAVDGVVKAKLPATECMPPLKLELANVWPLVSVLAVGQIITIGVAWPMTSVLVALPV